MPPESEQISKLSLITPREGRAGLERQITTGIGSGEPAVLAPVLPTAGSMTASLVGSFSFLICKLERALLLRALTDSHRTTLGREECSPLRQKKPFACPGSPLPEELTHS